jgi:hypothetical protein
VLHCALNQIAFLLFMNLCSTHIQHIRTNPVPCVSSDLPQWFAAMAYSSSSKVDKQ